MKREKSSCPEVDRYIAEFPPQVRARLTVLRDLIRSLAPEATEKISYRMPTYDLHGALVHFAGYAHHIGFYPTPEGVLAFSDRLAGFKSSKGAIQFPHDAPLPLDLVREIVLLRRTQNLEKHALKRKK